MRPQTAGAKEPLQPTDSFCIHQPFPQRCAKPYHQPHCFIAHAHQRPVGVSEWREDGRYHYKKAGVIVWNISPDTAVQAILFDSIDRAKQARLSVAIDAINRRNGFNTVKVAVQGTDKRWHLKCEHKSDRYSTNLNEIIKVKI